MFQASERCSAVLRRMLRICSFSIVPHLLKSGRTTFGARFGGGGFVLQAHDQLLGEDLDVAFADASAGPLPFTWTMSIPISRARRRTVGDAATIGRPGVSGVRCTGAPRSRTSGG